MVIALVGLALAMIAGGVWAVVEGYGIIVLERGWALVISGATVASLGAVLLGIAVAVARLGAIRGELGRLRERMSRPEPAFPEPPGPMMDPIAAVSSGLLAGGATDPGALSGLEGPPIASTAPHPIQATSAAAAPAPAPEADTTARIARREEAAERRAQRAARESTPAQPLGAGTLVAGAAAAAAAGAAVSAGLAAMRGRGEANDDLSLPTAGPLPADAAPAGGGPASEAALRGLDRPAGGEPSADRGKSQGSSTPSGAGGAQVTWPVVPTEPSGDKPAFPSGPDEAQRPTITATAGAVPETALAPNPAGSAEEDAPYANREPVVPDSAGAPAGGDSPATDATETPAVLGTYNSGGNRYVMFSDGSIEAETPEGTFRFGSLDELKAFVASGGERPREG